MPSAPPAASKAVQGVTKRDWLASDRPACNRLIGAVTVSCMRLSKSAPIRLFWSGRLGASLQVFRAAVRQPPGAARSLSSGGDG
jgi:hypothetical protein